VSSLFELFSNLNDYKYNSIDVSREIKSKGNTARKIFDIIKDKGFIAGGFAREMLVGDNVYEDIDVFPRSEEDYYTIKNEFDNRFKFIKDSLYAIAYEANFENGIIEKLTIIKPFPKFKKLNIPDSLKGLLYYFDFHCIRVGFGWDVVENKMYGLKCNNFRYMYDRINVEVGKQDIFLTLYRVEKYIKKGFKIKANDLSILTEEWNKRIKDKDLKLDIHNFDEMLNSRKGLNAYKMWLDNILDNNKINKCRKLIKCVEKRKK
jgi:hypothetical protein